MRNRELIKFLIYPKFFSSLAIPYKGKYLIRIRLYQKKLLNDKITYSYTQVKEFTDIKSLKPVFPARVSRQLQDSYYETETFYLYYSDQKIILNTYSIFTLQYDELREFNTYLEFQLVRKCDNNEAELGCMHNHKDMKQQQLICKQIYLVNNYKKLDSFQRVYFQHHQFYCALDLFILTISMGKFQRKQKIQLLKFSLEQNQVKKNKSQTKQTIKKYIPLLDDLIVQINEQVAQYGSIRKNSIKYQLIAIPTKSFLFQVKQIYQPQPDKDLSYLKYSHNTYENMPLNQALADILEDKKMINQNITYVFSKLPKIIKAIPYPTFKSLIEQSLKKKFDLKKKYLWKKIIRSSTNSFEDSTVHNKVLSPRQSFQKSSEIITMDFLRNSCTFKENRKKQKQQFVHIRRQQFVKAFQIISLKQCSFPMMLIQKSTACLFKQDKRLSLDKMKIKDNDSSLLQQVNLVVLVHGYQGSHHDLKKLKNYLEHINPNLKILAINSIQKNTGENIEFLGQKIASEIDFYVSNSYQTIKGISFIGFSLGGVLARACLKYLPQYKHLMNILITLASPHLGVSQSENALVNIGVWYLSKIDKAKNIKQLNFQSVTQKDSFLMKLSQGNEIGWFKKVVIISCSEDEFVPHYSARIIGETKNEQINIMASNILSHLKDFQRIQVWFDVEKKNSFDKLIGRKSHIEFIQNFSFLQMLCKMYEQDF